MVPERATRSLEFGYGARLALACITGVGPPPPRTPPSERSRRPPGSRRSNTLGELLLDESAHTLGQIVDETVGELVQYGHIRLRRRVS
jgi:hypothetical protein